MLRNALVWDNHGCLPLRADDGFLPQLERYRAAGADVVSINVGYGEMSWAQHLEILAFMRGWIAERPRQYRLVATADDAERCRAEGRLGIVFDVEGMVPVQDDPGRVQTLYELGVRWMLIAYNRNNAAGGGCLDRDGGLTAAGRSIIDEMRRVGMTLCLSHAGARTAAEALAYAPGPVIFSHSNAWAVTPHPRNISDELMRACARKGGVIGLNGIGLFLGGGTDLSAAFLRHLRHALDLVGPEHVGLGLDYVFDQAEVEDFIRNNPQLFPAGSDQPGARQMLPPEALPQIADALASLGLSDAHVGAVLGGNWLRIARQVWK